MTFKAITCSKQKK